MSDNDVFNKRLHKESTFDRIEGVLEHLNLPPKTVEWIRHNRRFVTLVVILLVAGVIAYSVYDSIRSRHIENAASALSVAGDTVHAEKIAALEKVVKEFGSTPSGLWAEVKIAQTLIKDGKFKEGAVQYGDLMTKVDEKNPLYALLVYGKAVALEGAKSFPEAVPEYQKLQNIVGYESLGFLGEGRILEEQGNREKAIGIYNDFLLKASGDQRLAGDKPVFESRVARLKAVMGK